MIRNASLVLYRNRPALVVSQGERYEIITDSGECLRIRAKDMTLLHEGPIAKLPVPAEGGDFETARIMLTQGSEAPVSTSWAEISELVFGESNPRTILACLGCAAEGLAFYLDEGIPVARDDADLAREQAKRERKAAEAAGREAFLTRARAVRKGANLEKTEENARYIGEIEALALGKTPKSPLAQELGISQTPEAAHGFLLGSGWWDASRNPHPTRAGCPTRSPNLRFDTEQDAPLPRLDLTGFQSWAIDNEWSTDPDDAIGWDGEHFWIHIADPASAIRPDSLIDLEALARGATLYLPELISPMLPDEAVERYGLGLGPTSPALSIRVDVDAEGHLTDTEILLSTVRVRRSHYGEADALLAAGDEDLRQFDALAKQRQARRVANGAVEISIPEVRVHVRDGEVLIHRPGEFRSSDIVREFMVLAGEAAAQWAFRRRLAFPFSSQEAHTISAQDLASESLSAQFSRRRGMKAGMLGPSPAAHRGLGLSFYAQITSPLRRYQDLLGHMQIHATLGGRVPLESDEVSRRCALVKAAQGPARKAEWQSETHWTLVWLMRHSDWHGDAILLAPTGPGTWACYIPELGMESRIRIKAEASPDSPIHVHVARLDLPALEAVFEPV